MAKRWSPERVNKPQHYDLYGKSPIKSSSLLASGQRASAAAKSKGYSFGSPFLQQNRKSIARESSSKQKRETTSPGRNSQLLEQQNRSLIDQILMQLQNQQQFQDQMPTQRMYSPEQRTRNPKYEVSQLSLSQLIAQSPPQRASTANSQNLHASRNYNYPLDETDDQKQPSPKAKLPNTVVTPTRDSFNQAQLQYLYTEAQEKIRQLELRLQQEQQTTTQKFKDQEIRFGIMTNYTQRLKQDHKEEIKTIKASQKNMTSNQDGALQLEHANLTVKNLSKQIDQQTLQIQSLQTDAKNHELHLKAQTDRFEIELLNNQKQCLKLKDDYKEFIDKLQTRLDFAKQESMRERQDNNQQMVSAITTSNEFKDKSTKLELALVKLQTQLKDQSQQFQQIQSEKQKLNQLIDDQSKQNISTKQQALESYNTNQESDLQDKLVALEKIVAEKQSQLGEMESHYQQELRFSLLNQQQMGENHELEKENLLLEIEAVRNKLLVAEQEVESAQLQNQHLKSQLRDMDDKVDNLLRKEETATGNFAQLQNEMQDLQHKLKHQANAIQSQAVLFESQIQTLEAEKNKEKATCETHLCDMEWEKGLLSLKVSELEQIVQKSAEERENLNQNTTKLQLELQELAQQFQSSQLSSENYLTAKYESQKQTTEDLSEANQCLLAEIQNLKVSNALLMDQLQKDNEANQFEMNKFEQKLTEAASEFELCKAELKSTVENIQNQEEEICKLQSQLDQKEKSLVSETSDQIYGLVKQLKETQAQVEELSLDRDQAKQQYNKQSDQLVDLIKELEQKTEQFREKEISWTEQMQKLKECVRERDDLKEEVEEYQEHVKALQQEYDAHKKQVNDLSQKQSVNFELEEQCSRMSKELVKQQSAALAAQSLIQKNSFENRQMLQQIEDLEDKLAEALSNTVDTHQSDQTATLELTERLVLTEPIEEQKQVELESVKQPIVPETQPQTLLQRIESIPGATNGGFLAAMVRRGTLQSQQIQQIVQQAATKEGETNVEEYESEDDSDEDDSDDE